MASAAANHIGTLAAASDDEAAQAAAAAFTPESILGNILYYRIHDYVQQLALVQLLPEICQQHPKVKLVVMDSIAFHFRHDFDDYALRTRLLNGMASELLALASQRKLAVVLMNQMTTKLGAADSGAGGAPAAAGGGGDRHSHLVPALGTYAEMLEHTAADCARLRSPGLRDNSHRAPLHPNPGESWGHASTIRVIMFWDRMQRYATLYKAPALEERTIAYDVTVGFNHIFFCFLFCFWLIRPLSALPPPQADGIRDTAAGNGDGDDAASALQGGAGASSPSSSSTPAGKRSRLDPNA